MDTAVELENRMEIPGSEGGESLGGEGSDTAPDARGRETRRSSQSRGRTAESRYRSRRMDERIRIYETILYARDLEAAAAFYGGALGLRA